MNLPRKQEVIRKRVGSLDGKPVYYVAGRGGIHMLAVDKGEEDLSPLGAGSHPLIAKLIASKRHKNLRLDSLEKAETLRPGLLTDLVPFWENYTDRLIAKYASN